MSTKNNINFVCEQDGDSEREFKNKLSQILEKKTICIRAYLVRVNYGDSHEFNVALCFITSNGKDQSLLSDSISCFKSMFGFNEHVDIIFINNEQEMIIRKFSCPFFVSPGYQVETPDFYLISTEGYGLFDPIECFKRKRLYGNHPDGYLLCDIQPALISQKYGVKSEGIKQIVLASRHRNVSLFPISEWPAYVHVAVPLTDKFSINDNITESAISLIAWGEVYRSKAEAITNKPG